jgi:23S rRNA (adenine2503-C2)-methyltransferase
LRTSQTGSIFTAVERTNSDPLSDVKALTAEELLAQFKAWGEPAYRVPQLLDWVYRRHATSWDAMTNLSRSLRDKLRGVFALGVLELVRVQGAKDTTRKFLWRLGDHSLIESVLIPANPALYGEASDRQTLCLSTQVGCAYGCKFCASGLLGWKRNLRVDEIVDQVLATERWNRREAVNSTVAGPAHDAGESPPTGSARLPADASAPSDNKVVSNIVVMGMGEPLANYDNLLKGLTILNAPWGGGIGARKITISTSGLAPQIRQLADESPQYRLAISLHGATDEVRSRLMPVNRKFPLAELMAACEHYVRKKGRLLTFEYILIEGVNDDLTQATALAALARRLHAKVNLIPYNEVDGLHWVRPRRERQEAFLSALERARVNVTFRREKGGDIDAACGQLRLKTERELERRVSNL